MKFRYLLSAWTGALVSILLTSCSTAPHITRLSQVSELLKTPTGVVIPIRLETSHPIFGTGSCTLAVRNTKRFRAFEIEFKTGKEILTAELAPGIYSFKEIYCAGRHWDLTFKKWPGFQIYSGKLSFIGGVWFDFDANGLLTGRGNGSEKNRDELLTFINRLSATERNQLVSGYTGQSLPPSNLESPARWPHWEVTDPAGTHVLRDDKNWPSTKLCVEAERELNELTLGNVEFKVVYEKKDLIESVQLPTWHSYSGSFIQCVRSALENHHPKTRGRITYNLVL